VVSAARRFLRRRESGRFSPGDKVRVEPRFGAVFYGLYFRHRPTEMYEHLVQIEWATDTRKYRPGDILPATDREVSPCEFVVPPTSISDVDDLLSS